MSTPVPAQTSMIIGFGNLANAANDEKHEKFRFGARESKIHDTISTIKPHVFAASELRTCMDKTNKFQLTPTQIAINLSKGTCLSIADCRPQNLDPMSFWRSTLFDPSKLQMNASGCEWAIEPVFGSFKVEERGVMLLFTQFSTLDKRHTFWVINSHMPIAKAQKLKVIEWLNKNAEDTCKNRWKDETPIIFYGGDQNTFFNSKTLFQTDGKEMMTLFSEKWIHVTPDIKETFRSFPHDSFQGTDVLDHIFLNKSAQDKVKILAATAHDTGASDHYFLTVAVDFL